MDLSSRVPKDGEVYALSTGDNCTRAEFVYTPGSDGAERRVAWRLYDRYGKGILLTEAEMLLLARLTHNYFESLDD